jgi:AcrR family transcriptional regulator
MPIAARTIIGRPRRNPRPLDRPPREEILASAARLFAEKGFAETTTRNIAEASGLQQASLFYYFNSKEDILREISERALVRPLEALAAIGATNAPPDVKLYLAVRFHTWHLASEPLDLRAVLQESFRITAERFAAWHEGANRYSRELRALLEDGIAEGVFRPMDTLVATMALLGMINWTGRWYRAGGRITPAALADEMAHQAVRSVLRNCARADDVVRSARSLALDLGDTSKPAPRASARRKAMRRPRRTPHS